MSAPASPRRGATQVLRNTAVIMVARIGERATGLVLALLIAARLGPDDLGAWSVAITVYYVFAIIGDSGATQYLVREVSRDPSRTGSYLVHLSAIVVVATSALIAVSLAVIPHVGWSDTVATSVSIVLIGVIPRTLNALQEGVFIAYGRTEFQAVVGLAGSLVQVLASIALLSTGHGVPAVVAAFVAVQYGVTLTYFVLVSRRITRLRLHLELGVFRRLILEIRGFAASSIVSAAFQRPEIILLSLIASDRQIGYYSAAVRLAEVWFLIPDVFMNNVYPVLSESFRRAEERFAAVQERATRAILAYSLPIAALGIATAPLIIGEFFGDDFAPAHDLLRLLAFNIVLTGMMAVWWRVLYARGMENVVLGVALVMAAVRLGAGAGLIAAFGALGAAIAAPATTALHVALLAGSGRRRGAPAPSVVAISWRFAAAASVAGCVSWALMDAGTSIWVIAPLAAAIYAGTAAAFGAFRPEDRALLRRIARRAPVIDRQARRA